jgi:hypothetical protein
LLLSPNCRYLQINQRLTAICGISVEDHIGRSVWDCVPALAEAVEGIVCPTWEVRIPEVCSFILNGAPEDNN